MQSFLHALILALALTSTSAFSTRRMTTRMSATMTEPMTGVTQAISSRTITGIKARRYTST